MEELTPGPAPELLELALLDLLVQADVVTPELLLPLLQHLRVRFLPSPVPELLLPLLQNFPLLSRNEHPLQAELQFPLFYVFLALGEGAPELLNPFPLQFFGFVGADVRAHHLEAEFPPAQYFRLRQVLLLIKFDGAFALFLGLLGGFRFLFGLLLVLILFGFGVGGLFGCFLDGFFFLFVVLGLFRHVFLLGGLLFWGFRLGYFLLLFGGHISFKIYY